MQTVRTVPVRNTWEHLTFQKNSPGRIKDTVVDPVDPTNERTSHSSESVQRLVRNIPRLLTQLQVVHVVSNNEAEQDDSSSEECMFHHRHVSTCVFV